MFFVPSKTDSGEAEGKRGGGFVHAKGTNKEKPGDRETRPNVNGPVVGGNKIGITRCKIKDIPKATGQYFPVTERGVQRKMGGGNVKDR